MLNVIEKWIWCTRNLFRTHFGEHPRVAVTFSGTLLLFIIHVITSAVVLHYYFRCLLSFWYLFIYAFISWMFIFCLCKWLTQRITYYFITKYVYLLSNYYLIPLLLRLQCYLFESNATSNVQFSNIKFYYWNYALDQVCIMSGLCTRVCVSGTLYLHLCIWVAPPYEYLHISLAL